MKLRLRSFSGPLVVLMWQAVPVGPAPDSVGRTRIWFGYARGQFEDVSTSCDGDVIGVDGIDYGSGGARIDLWPLTNLRVTGFGGRRSYGEPRRLFGASDGAGWPGAPDVTYGGGEIAWESQKFGFGLGLARSPDHEDFGESYTLPTGYLRIGDIDQAHFRTDLFAPGETHRSTGEWRIGAESNTGHLRGPGWFAGLALCHFCNDKGNTGIFGELYWPVQSHFDIVLRGFAHSGEERMGWSFGAGGRASF